MADRKSLRLIGMVYGGVTAAVILVAGFVVSGHMLGHLQFDRTGTPVVTAAANLQK